eukprot:866806-Rhodomonas_salina.2
MSLPLTIDESGETVPNDIVNAARGRGLELKFGPGAGEWKVVAGPGGAQLVEAGRSKRKGVVIGESEQEQGQIELMPRQLAPEGFGVSVGASREDLRQFVNKFESSAEHAQRGDGEFAASYMELTVLSVVGINCLVMAMEHYRGRINMECEDAVNCPHNIEIMSPGFRLFINLAEYFFNGEAPNTESASGKGNHCSDVDTHWKPSGLQSLGISRSSCSMHARWQIVHSPGSMHAVLKILAAGSFLRYIISQTNRFDFALVMISVLAYLFQVSPYQILAPSLASRFFPTTRSLQRAALSRPDLVRSRRQRVVLPSRARAACIQAGEAVPAAAHAAAKGGGLRRKHRPRPPRRLLHPCGRRSARNAGQALLSQNWKRPVFVIPALVFLAVRVVSLSFWLAGGRFRHDLTPDSEGSLCRPRN